ncbi:hypothetical protein ACHAQJ_003408 [Trichoderma viride]
MKSVEVTGGTVGIIAESFTARDVNLNFGTQGSQDELDEKFLRDLKSTYPSLDKERIRNDKGGLLRESYRWILETPEYNEWKTSKEHRLLWVRGDPGKGKTMLMCGITDELDKLRTTPSVTQNSLSNNLLYFFCQATDERINNGAAVLRGLILMLAQQQRSLISHIRKKYGINRQELLEGKNHWTALVEILLEMLRNSSSTNTYIVIDALDECVSQRPDLLTFVRNLSTLSSVKCMVSSRDWPEIEQQLNPSIVVGGIYLSLETNADVVSGAVNAYIAHEMSKLSFLQDDEDLRNQILQKMFQQANGTFLWVALVFKELQEKLRYEFRTDLEILNILETIPGELKALYARMVHQTLDYRGEDPELCIRVLSTMSLAYRPLHLCELRILAGFQDNLARPSTLVRLVKKCGSFLTIRDNTIYFIHQSAKHYIMNDETARNLIFASGYRDTFYDIFSRSSDVMSNVRIAASRTPGRPDRNTEPGSSKGDSIFWCNSASHLGKQIPDHGNVGSSRIATAIITIASFLYNHILYWLRVK